MAAVALPDAFDALTGTAPDGASGLRLPMPPGALRFHVVSGENACGEGPR